MFDDIRLLHDCRRFAKGVTDEVATASAIGAMRKNPLYCTFVEAQHGLDVMMFYEFDAKPMHYDVEHVSRFLDESSHTLTAVDIADALDKVFMFAVNQYPYPFCKGPPSCHMFKQCSAAFMCERTAYAKGQNGPEVEY